MGAGIDCTVLNPNYEYCLVLYGKPDTHPEGNRAETGVPAEEEEESTPRHGSAKAGCVS